jgi:hypothetical protein
MAIQFKRGTKAQWLASSLVLAAGQPGVATDTGEVRVGDGNNTWSNLRAGTLSGSQPVGQGELVVDAAYYGIGSSAGVADDAAKWADAFGDVPAGATLQLPAGSTSRLTAGVTRTSPVVIKGQGSTLIPDFDGNLFNLSASYGTPVGITTISTVTQAEVGGATGTTHVLTLATAQPWKPGDFVKVVSDDEIPEARPGSGTGSDAIASRIGEFAVVRSVSGASVTLGGMLRETYTTNPRVALVPMQSAALHDLTITSPNFDSSAYSNALIVASRLANPVISNLVVRGAPATVLLLKSCLGYTVRRYTAMFARNNPNAGQYGYGLNDNACSFGNVEQMLFGYGRHAFTDDTPRITANNSDLTNYGRSYSATVQGHAIGTSAQAWDSHAAGEAHKYRVSASNIASGYAVQLRGRNHEVEVTAERCRGALAVFEESAGGFTYGIQASKVIARDCTEAAIKAALAPTGHPSGAGTRRTDHVALTVSGKVIVRGTPRVLDISNAVVDVSDLKAKAVPVQPAEFPELILNTNSEIRGSNNCLDLTTNTANEPTPVRTATGAPTPAVFDLDGFRVKASDDSATRVQDVFTGPNSVSLKLRRGRLSHRFAGKVLGSYDPAVSTVQFTLDGNDVNSGYLFKAATDFTTGSGIAEVPSIDDPTIYVNINPASTSFNAGVMPAGRKRGQRMLISLTAAGGGMTFTPGIGNRLALLSGVTTITGLGAQMELIWDGTYWREVGNLRQAPVPLFGLLSTGQETVPRWAVTGTTSMSTGVLRMGVFTARDTLSVSNIRMVTGGATVTNGTPTLVKFGLYSVASDGSATLLAATASDTTIFGATNSVYTRALTSSQVITAGQTYGIAALVVTAATTPPTVPASTTTLPTSEVSQTPVGARTVSGQSDLAASYAAGVLTPSTATIYAVAV